MADTQYRAPALDKGLDILEFLAVTHQAQSMSDIARALGRSRNEIYRMTLALERRGYVERAGDSEKFRLSHRLYELAMKSAPAFSLHEAALPVMNRLAEDTQQSNHLAVRSGDEIVVVARVESPSDVGFAVRVGHRRTLIQSASGLVFFGTADGDERARIRAALEDGTVKKSDLTAFEAEAEKVGKKGYVLRTSPIIDGITDIGAPIYDGQSASAVACLMVPFVSIRRDKATARQAASQVRQAAQDISLALQTR